MPRKVSLKEYLKKKEVFKPETRLHSMNRYMLSYVISFLNRNDKMILGITFAEDKFKDITEEELLKSQKETEEFYIEQYEEDNRELSNYFLEKCEDDFPVAWESFKDY